MTAQEIITSGMKKLATVAAGENPTASELADGLSTLQSMLRSWAADRQLVFASTKDAFILTAGTGVYTWGTGGNFTTARPNNVLGAYISDSDGISHPPMDLISEAKYRSISVKSTQSRPYSLFFHPAYPLANVYLYPVPDTIDILHIDSMKPFTETSSFDALGSVLAFPSFYEEAIVYNFAVCYASAFGKVISADVVAIARNSYERITNLNASQQIEAIGLSLPLGRSTGRYSINSDSYH